MNKQEIVVEKHKGVATLLLNRPNVHNALSGEMMEKFKQACEELSNDSEVKVVVLKGAGEKSFCSGADLGGMSEDNNIINFKKHVTKYRDCLLALRKMKKPIIGAINGYALAGGLGLAVSCDLVYAKESAQFGAPEINVGLWGMMISSPLVNSVGQKKAFELMYTGDRINAEKAKEIGLINEFFLGEEFEEKVYEMAEKLSAKNPVALSLGRESMYMIQNMDYESSLTYLRDQVVVLSRTEDYNEGMSAFKEKRDPIWTGR
ncbi:2,3-dehydroadipyl-CoA hydratase [Oceanobacillus oncorhynchi]|uniref:2,3-dehydroadipyl-CoA hydratase n=1 Tax=Oceanobacillus oncorhynchi TaxID=545501 RepID=A0A0A1MSH9_9BACI|nr:enoyl-CoA hydratase/isomerase family protein [Oceanobacillus oncorhynchi]CEI82639.1 2,3-dehydroadipyl-CoA hydratase [Oceanobacillus oncorhynchi]